MVSEEKRKRDKVLGGFAYSITYLIGWFFLAFTLLVTKNIGRDYFESKNLGGMYGTFYDMTFLAFFTANIFGVFFITMIGKAIKNREREKYVFPILYAVYIVVLAWLDGVFVSAVFGALMGI